jgi:hypothetical protein
VVFPTQKRFTWLDAAALAPLWVVVLASWANRWWRERDEFRRLEMQGELFVSKCTGAVVRKVSSVTNWRSPWTASATTYVGLRAGRSFLLICTLRRKR